MLVFKIDDPNMGLRNVMRALDEVGLRSDSRNGPVIRFPEPVALHYTNPRRRILDDPLREANHFFHLFESIWMFAGLDTVAPLDPYNSRMKQYSDDGVRFEAAYGHRWRVRWGDQIRAIVNKLKENPLDRRIVLQMWDPKEIFKKEGLDFACNQQVLFSTRPMPHCTGGHVLDITVTNRSNDLIYGAMGSNLFHFSLLQEYIAHHAGIAVGDYHQMSVNLHLYTENEASKKCWAARTEDCGASPESDCSLNDNGIPLQLEPLQLFVNENRLDHSTVNGYLGVVVRPIVESYQFYKIKSLKGIEIPLEKRIDICQEMLKSCKSKPLQYACRDWFHRRRNKPQTKGSTLG